MQDLFTRTLLLLAEGDLSIKQSMMLWVAEYSYLGVFVFLLACGLGFPAPEEIALIGGGYAIYLDDPNSWPKVWLMILVAMIGVLIGDSILWWFGRRIGETPEKLPLIGRHLTPQRMRRARAMFRKHGAKAVFFGRFLFGIRAVTFFVSGSLRVPLGTFLLMDGLAALLTVPASILLAWHFGGELEEAADWISRVDGFVLTGAAIAGLVFLLVFLRRRKRILTAVDAQNVLAESESELPACKDSEASKAGAKSAEPSDKAKGAEVAESEGESGKTPEPAERVAAREPPASAPDDEAGPLVE